MTIDWARACQFAIPEESVGYQLWQVIHLWQRQVDIALTELDLTHLQFVLLVGIAWSTRDGDLLTQVQLAEFCKIDVMQISQVVRKLEFKRLIHRRTHPTDTRAKVLMVSVSGEKVLEQALPIIDRLDGEFFGRCNQQNLLRELKKLH